MNSVLVAILAAGESRRMGAPKLCLAWNDTTVLGHLLDQWREAGAEKILVVHAPDTGSPVVLELNRLGIPASQRAVNTAMARGMMGSVVTAAARAAIDPAITHLIIALGDQPHLRTETLRGLLDACKSAPDKIVRVVFQGKAGHPIALPANLLAELTATPCATLRDFLATQKNTVLDLTCPDSGVLLDIDTPDGYARARSAPQTQMELS